jgi:hypothetical protein
MFNLLDEGRCLDKGITGKMVKAVGFRDLIVPEYTRTEMRRVSEIAPTDSEDLTEYPFAVLRQFDLPGKREHRRERRKPPGFPGGSMIVTAILTAGMGTRL